MKNVFFFKPPRPGHPLSGRVRAGRPRAAAARRRDEAEPPRRGRGVERERRAELLPPRGEEEPSRGQGRSGSRRRPSPGQRGRGIREARAGRRGGSRGGGEAARAVLAAAVEGDERRRHGRRVRGGARRVERHRRPRRVGAREVDPPDVGQAHVDAGEGLAAPLRGGDLLEDVRNDLKMERRIVFLVFFGQ